MKRTADGQPRELERVSTAVYDDVAADRQRELRPLNSFVNPMLTDMYQVGPPRPPPPWPSPHPAPPRR